MTQWLHKITFFITFVCVTLHEIREGSLHIFIKLRCPQEWFI